MPVEPNGGAADPPHAPSNVGVALDGVGCACGWSAKATGREAKRDAYSAHLAEVGLA